MFSNVYEDNRKKKQRLIEAMNSYRMITEEDDWENGLRVVLKYICKHSFISIEHLDKALSKVDAIKENDKLCQSDRVAISVALLFLLQEGVVERNSKPILNKYTRCFGVSLTSIKKYIKLLLEEGIINPS